MGTQRKPRPKTPKQTQETENPQTDTSEDTDAKTLQEKVQEDIATGNVSGDLNSAGVRVVTESDAPVLGADFFAQHVDTKYVIAEAVLRNGNFEYEKYQVYVRLGIDTSDETAITEELDRLYPIPTSLKDAQKLTRQQRRQKRRKPTPQEQEWADKRVDARMRLILTRFLYQVPPKDAPEGFEPVPLLAWDPDTDAGWPVRNLNKTTLEELYKVWRNINPDGIPEEELDRFQSV